MKTLYFECNMGAAGDMLMAALLELHYDPKDFLERLNNIGIPGVCISSEPSTKCGIIGTHVKVQVNGHEEEIDNQDDDHEEYHHHHNHEHEDHHNHHDHNNIEAIQHLIDHLNVSDSVKKDALKVYELIAEAEGRVHGVPVSQIHFHEVGTMDAVADIVGVCMLIEEFAPCMILSSPINVGSGHVHCAHGILPVPAPATAYILHDVPIYNNHINGELCTPTGAALLKHFVNKFSTMPVMTVKKIGYGMGKKDFDMVNCVRVYLADIE